MLWQRSKHYLKVKPLFYFILKTLECETMIECFVQSSRSTPAITFSRSVPTYQIPAVAQKGILANSTL